jgi:hypothetical protein
MSYIAVCSQNLLLTFVIKAYKNPQHLQNIPRNKRKEVQAAVCNMDSNIIDIDNNTNFICREACRVLNILDQCPPSPLFEKQLAIYDVITKKLSKVQYGMVNMTLTR